MFLNDLDGYWLSKENFTKSIGKSQEADRKRVESRRNHVKLLFETNRRLAGF
jgi:hypothetical protein